MRTVIHTWKQKCANIQDPNSYWGFGDIIRGTIALYQLSKKIGFIPLVDIRLHPISEFLQHSNSSEHDQYVIENQMYIPFIQSGYLEQYILSLHENDVILLLTNEICNIDEIDQDCIDFIKSILRPKPEFSEYVESIIRKLPSQYHIFHCRIGDSELTTPNIGIYQTLSNHIQTKMHKDTILLSDSPYFKQFMNIRNFPTLTILDTKIAHVGRDQDMASIRDTLVDMFIVMGAKSIQSYTCYSWNSGFVFWLHKIFDIPFESIVDNKPLDFLQIYETEYIKTRIGSPNDGGYIVADLEGGYDLLLSCGISNDIQFEDAFLELHPHLRCLAFDGTIEELPHPSERIEFIKKNIANHDSETTTTMMEWIRGHSNIFLKMDIESNEYQWLQILEKDDLLRFKQITMEFHFPFTEGWDHFFESRSYVMPVEDRVNCMRRLAETHYMVHMHANNCLGCNQPGAPWQGGTSIYRGIEVPCIFECTYIRKDICRNVFLNRSPIPDLRLDTANISHQEDILLSGYPYSVRPFFTTPKTHFVTFGQGAYVRSLERIKAEARQIGIFDHIHAFGADDLTSIPAFWKKHQYFIQSQKRGYGYWLWKPFLVKHVLDSADEDDILVYSDTGCILNGCAMDKWTEYLNRVRHSHHGSLAFVVHTESQWTKMDLVEYLECPREHMTTPQLHATFFFLRKCANVVAMVNRWCETASIYPLLDDTPSCAPNMPGFQEHRHDQSIFSLIRKMGGTEVIEEPWPDYENPIRKVGLSV